MKRPITLLFLFISFSANTQVIYTSAANLPRAGDTYEFMSYSGYDYESKKPAGATFDLEKVLQEKRIDLRAWLPDSDFSYTMTFDNDTEGLPFSPQLVSTECDLTGDCYTERLYKQDQTWFAKVIYKPGLMTERAKAQYDKMSPLSGQFGWRYKIAPQIPATEYGTETHYQRDRDSIYSRTYRMDYFSGLELIIPDGDTIKNCYAVVSYPEVDADWNEIIIYSDQYRNFLANVWMKDAADVLADYTDFEITATDVLSATQTDTISGENIQPDLTLTRLSIRVFDLSGKEITVLNNISINQLNASDGLTPGTYILRFTENGTETSLQWVVK